MIDIIETALLDAYKWHFVDGAIYTGIGGARRLFRQMRRCMARRGTRGRRGARRIEIKCNGRERWCS